MYLHSLENRYVKGDPEYEYNKTDGIIVPLYLWNQYLNSCFSTMIVRLNQANNTQIAVVAGYHEDDRDSIYGPSTFFYTMKSDTVILQELWHPNSEEENLPLATKIYLRPLDNEVYKADIEKEVSTYLSNFQTLQTGQTIVVPIESLNGTLVDMYVEKCEPMDEVILRGDVILELLEPLIEYSAPKLDTTQFDFDAPMVPQNPTEKFKPFSGKGHKF
jgi:hypothetical protein